MYAHCAPHNQSSGQYNERRRGERNYGVPSSGGSVPEPRGGAGQAQGGIR